jgi:hypothetical protein
MAIGSTGALGGLNRAHQSNQNWTSGTKIPLPGTSSGVSFKDVAATQGVFNNMKTGAAPKITMPTK